MEKGYHKPDTAHAIVLFVIFLWQDVVCYPAAGRVPVARHARAEYACGFKPSMTP